MSESQLKSFPTTSFNSVCTKSNIYCKKLKTWQTVTGEDTVLSSINENGSRVGPFVMSLKKCPCRKTMIN